MKATDEPEILKGFYYDRMNNSPYKYKLIKRKKNYCSWGSRKICLCRIESLPESVHLDILDSLDEKCDKYQESLIVVSLHKLFQCCFY
jgi:hypothetical protein